MATVRDAACPVCGGAITYNGNYYCETPEGDICWAMNSDNPSSAEIEINRAYLEQRLERPHDEADRERLLFYLDRLSA